MAVIIADNKDVEILLKELVELLQNAGANIDPEIHICCENNVFSIRTPKNNTPRKLIVLSHDMLIPASLFDFGLHDDALLIKDTHEKASPLQKHLMEIMVALYNATHQIKQHKQQCPWLTFRESAALVEFLLKSRDTPYTREIQATLKTGDENDLTLLTFFKTRLLNVRLNKQWAKMQDVFLPLIDCMNHHPAGSKYVHLYSEKNGMLAVNYRPIENSEHECFVDYGRMDALDSFLHYGFVNEETRLVRSIPLHLNVEGFGELFIATMETAIKSENTPKALDGLGRFLPAIQILKNKKRAEFSSLFIPPENALFSLRRILKYTYTQLSPNQEEQIIAEAVKKTENLILDANLQYYERLKDFTDSFSKKQNVENIHKICHLQVYKIQTYRSLINNT